MKVTTANPATKRKKGTEVTKGIPETKNSIQEKQILVINKAMGQPACALRVVSSIEDGLNFQVFLTWNQEDWLHLYTQEGKPRNFKHFWHYLKWAAAHDIKSVELEQFVITEEAKKQLGLRITEADLHESDDARREGGPDLAS